MDSKRNRRYMNINVHAAGGEFWNLGMVRVYGSMPADKCVSLLEDILSEFDLSLKHDVVAICTDGASVKKKVSTLISAKQQLCYAHGLQLAVADVLYKRTVTRVESTPGQGELALEGSNSGSESESVDDGDKLDEGLKFEVIYEKEELTTELSDSYQGLINKVRKIVKIFRRSPTKNDAVLQKYATAEIGHELSLSLDCRTRWSSFLKCQVDL